MFPIKASTFSKLKPKSKLKKPKPRTLSGTRLRPRNLTPNPSNAAESLKKETSPDRLHSNKKPELGPTAKEAAPAKERAEAQKPPKAPGLLVKRGEGFGSAKFQRQMREFLREKQVHLGRQSLLGRVGVLRELFLDIQHLGASEEVDLAALDALLSSSKSPILPHFSYYKKFYISFFFLLYSSLWF